MDIYYMNHKNQKVDFMNGNYNVEESSFFSHEWDYESHELLLYGEKITQMKKKLQEHTLVVHIESAGFVSCEHAYNNLFDVVEADIFSEQLGKLFVNDAYMNCFITTNKPKYFIPGINSISCELSIITPYPFWTTEQFVTISKISSNEEAENGETLKTYPYTYPYTYPTSRTQVAVNIDHYMESDFQMKIYGPTDSVHVNIAGHPYIVEYPLDEGEYMVIDSRSYVAKDKRLYVVKNDGKAVNVFHYRDTEHSVFQKIPAGSIIIDYSRTYGIDLTIFKERSEPLWS